jgi:aryl-alcohol dehydrogenase-like predicted oxidoreductase
VRFILMNPGVTTVLGGFSDIAQMEEVCAATDLAPLSDDVMAKIAEGWRAS